MGIDIGQFGVKNPKKCRLFLRFRHETPFQPAKIFRRDADIRCDNLRGDVLYYLGAVPYQSLETLLGVAVDDLQFPLVEQVLFDRHNEHPLGEIVRLPDQIGESRLGDLHYDRRAARFEFGERGFATAIRIIRNGNGAGQPRQAQPGV